MMTLRCKVTSFCKLATPRHAGLGEGDMLPKEAEVSQGLSSRRSSQEDEGSPEGTKGSVGAWMWVQLEQWWGLC